MKKCKSYYSQHSQPEVPKNTNLGYNKTGWNYDYNFQLIKTL